MVLGCTSFASVPLRGSQCGQLWRPRVNAVPLTPEGSIESLLRYGTQSLHMSPLNAPNPMACKSAPLRFLARSLERAGGVAGLFSVL